MKGELIKQYDWSLAKAFNTLDVYQEGVISAQSIGTFLKINGFTSCTAQDIDAIVRRLDGDSDLSLTYADFIEAFRVRSMYEPREQMPCRREETSGLSAEKCSPLRRSLERQAPEFTQSK